MKMETRKEDIPDSGSRGIIIVWLLLRLRLFFYRVKGTRHAETRRDETINH